MNRDVEHRSVLPDAKQDTLKFSELVKSCGNPRGADNARGIPRIN